MASATEASFDAEMSDISNLEEKNAPFVQHATFDEELGTAVIDGEFLGDPSILTKPATVLEEHTGSFDSGNHNDYDDDYEVYLENTVYPLVITLREDGQ